jgi:hypothetical protein
VPSDIRFQVDTVTSAELVSLSSSVHEDGEVKESTDVVLSLTTQRISRLPDVAVKPNEKAKLVVLAPLFAAPLLTTVGNAI